MGSPLDIGIMTHVVMWDFPNARLESGIQFTRQLLESEEDFINCWNAIGPKIYESYKHYVKPGNESTETSPVVG